MLSLCLIARDEEAMLPGCLASARGVVDEVVVIDTGSTDATARVAEQAGARVVHWAWRDDFAAARNEAVAHARGDWVLVLDADERLAPGALPALRKAMSQRRADAGLLRLHDAATLDAAAADVLAGRARLGEAEWLPRLFRHTPDLQWESRVHENVRSWLRRRQNRVVRVEADIVHLGAVPQLRAARRKQERNLFLLRKQVQAFPRDLYAWGSLAMEAWQLGRLDEAEHASARGLDLLSERSESRGLRAAAIAALVALERGDDARALAAAEAGIAHDGPHPDLLFLRGWARERLGQLEAAIADARAALACRGAPQDDSCIAGATTHLGQTRLGAALLLAGQPAQARAAFEEALRQRPGHAEAQIGAAKARLAAGDAKGALAACEPLLARGHRDAWKVAAAAASALGLHDDAALFERRAAGA
ncbi:MAG TPA: glycosyltransferase [Myxococcales bacterium]|nr:glycosyltransferase [Myxococcales bacterium]